MQGLILDRSAPLYGRAAEIPKIAPLPCGWIRKALHLRDDRAAIEAYAIWGGVPRYWELAADFSGQQEAVQALALSPLGVLYDEPSEGDEPPPYRHPGNGIFIRCGDRERS